MKSFQKKRKQLKPFYSLSADFTTSPYYHLYSHDFKLTLNNQIGSELGANTNKAHLHLDMSFANSSDLAGKGKYHFKGDTDSNKDISKDDTCMRPMKIKCSSLDKICLDEEPYAVHNKSKPQYPIFESPTFSPIKISNTEATPYNMESPCMTPIEGSPMLHYMVNPFSPAVLDRKLPEMIFPSGMPSGKHMPTIEAKHDSQVEEAKDPLNKTESQIKEQETLICTICERAIPSRDFRKHLDLCRDKAELQKDIVDIDGQISWVVLQAFMTSKTLQRNIIYDRKKSGKLQSLGINRHPRTYTEIKGARSLNPSSEKVSQGNGSLDPPKKLKTRHISIQFDSKDNFRTRNSNTDKIQTSMTLTSFSEVKMQGSTPDECQSLGTCSIYLPGGDGLEDSFNDSETRNTQEEIDTSIISETQRLNLHKRALSIEARLLDSPRSDILSNIGKTSKETNIFRMARHASESVCSSTPNMSNRTALANRFPASRVPSFEGYIPKVVPRKSLFCPKKAEIAEEDKKEEEKSGEEEMIHQEVKSDEEAEEEKKEVRETVNSGEEVNMRSKVNQGSTERKKIKSITVYGHGSSTSEQFIELRKRMQEKKQIDVYKAIQKHAKIVINKDVYTIEMSLTNRTIVSHFDELTSQVNNENTLQLSKQFVNLFQKRVAAGKEHEKVQNILNKLEGKLEPETPDNLKRRTILLQQKSFKNRLELKSMSRKGKEITPSQNIFSRQNSSLQKIVSTPKQQESQTSLYTFDEKQEIQQPAESLAYLTEDFVQPSSPVLSSQSLDGRECSSMQDLPTDVKSQSICFEHFDKIKLISKGGCAEVWLVRRKATEELYAMKVINLARREQRKNDLDNLTKENRVLKLAEEEHVTRAVFVFTHKTCVCFVMEFMQGGDLRQIINKYFIDEYSAKFYIAELVLAIEYLHSLGIIHRDLKPENVLLNKDGHTKLADFGLSEIGLSEKIHNNRQPEDLKLKITQQLLSTNEYESESIFNPNMEARPLGTDYYMAPEVVKAVSITNKTLDWWSLGVMLFELLTGELPFDGDTTVEIREKIILGQIPWHLARKESPLSEEAKDLISGLLNLEYQARLGANGAKEIKEHEFFKDINWEDLRKQPTPISFSGLKDTDTGNFADVIEKDDPFAVVNQHGNTERNMFMARQFIQKSKGKFQMVNIKALYSEGLAAIEKIEAEKEKKIEKEHGSIQYEKSFTDISEDF